MSELQFFQFPCLSDNYGVLVHDPVSGLTASIDAPDAAPIQAALKEKDWKLSHILVTHHHYDHTQGIEPLKLATACQVWGPGDEADKIKLLDKTFIDGDQFEFAGRIVKVIGTPGHTLGMINYYFEESATVFTGDTLFALGCGRIFEGNPEMMWQSLCKLAQLPAETKIYCGHEYTLANARFAVTIDPNNAQLTARLAKIEQLRGAEQPTLPTSIQEELATNPFLRTSDAAIRQNLDMENSSDAEVFAEIRKRKDNA